MTRTRIYTLAIGLLCFISFAFPQQQNEVNLSTPYHTVLTHLQFLQHDNYQPQKAAKTINVSDPAQAKNLAIKLKQLLDGEGLYVDMETIPREPNYKDTATGLHRYVLFRSYPDIYVEKEGSKWLYSKRTAEVIPELHKDVFPLGSDFLVNLFPEYGHREFLGLELWQYFGILLIILLCVFLHKIFTLVLRAIIVRVMKRLYDEKADLEKALYAARPLSLFVIMVILVVFVPVVQLPINLAKYITMAINAFTPLFAMIFFYRLVDFVAIHFERLAEKTENTLDDQLIPLVKKSLKIFIIVVGSLFVLQQLKFNVTTILAGLSIGGLAFALAAQDTIKNLFGSLMIFLDRPFQIGDWIQSGNIDGTIEEVGFRSTRVRTFANSLVYVPNAHIADTTVDNMGRRVYRRFKTTIGLTYDTPPALMEAFVEGMRQIVENHPATRKDYYEIHMNDFGASSLNILFYIFFDVPDWSSELKSRHEVMLAVINLADELGVQFAFPTQTLHVENFPGKESLSPVYETDKTKIREKVTAFLEKFKAGHGRQD